MANLKHADQYTSAFNSAQDKALEPDAMTKLGASDGKKIVVAAIRSAGGRPKPADALAHLMARRPELFTSEEEATSEEAPRPTQTAIAQA